MRKLILILLSTIGGILAVVPESNESLVSTIIGVSIILLVAKFDWDPKNQDSWYHGASGIYLVTIGLLPNSMEPVVGIIFLCVVAGITLWSGLDLEDLYYAAYGIGITGISYAGANNEMYWTIALGASLVSIVVWIILKGNLLLGWYDEHWYPFIGAAGLILMSIIPAFEVLILAGTLGVSLAFLYRHRTWKP